MGIEVCVVGLPRRMDSTIRHEPCVERGDGRILRVDNHPQFGLMRSLGPGAAASVDRLNAEKVFAIARCMVVEKLYLGLTVRQMLPTRTAIL